MWARINQTRHLYAWKPIFSIFILSKESCVVIELIRDRWNRWNIVLNTIYINLLSRMEEARLNRKVRNNFRELEYKSYQKKEKKILSKRWYLNSILSFLFFLIFESNRRIRTKEYNFFRLKPRFQLFIKRRPIHNSKWLFQIRFENKIWNGKNFILHFRFSFYKIILRPLVPLFIQSRVAYIKPPFFFFLKKCSLSSFFWPANLELKLLFEFFNRNALSGKICFCIKIQSRGEISISFISQSSRCTIRDD